VHRKGAKDAKVRKGTWSGRWSISFRRIAAREARTETSIFAALCALCAFAVKKGLRILRA
jgi:hypothetical protein